MCQLQTVIPHKMLILKLYVFKSVGGECVGEGTCPVFVGGVWMQRPETSETNILLYYFLSYPFEAVSFTEPESTQASAILLAPSLTLLEFCNEAHS